MGILERFFGKKPPSSPPVLSEESLRAVFGEENVKYATCIAVDVVDPDMVVAGRDQIGGVPANIGADRWPTCADCNTPMTFIGRVACGPEELVRYPARGSVAIFLCNSEPPSIEQLCATYEGEGYSDVFFVEEGTPASSMFDEKQLRAIAEAQRANKRYSLDRSSPYPKQFLLPARDGFRGRPALGNAFRVERRATLSFNSPPSHEAAELHYAFSEQHPELFPPIAIEIDTFPMWVQGMEHETCACGAPMELLLQFDAFDDAINLGDAGRAYVFACEKRCGPRSFILRWTCC